MRPPGFFGPGCTTPTSSVGLAVSDYQLTGEYRTLKLEPLFEDPYHLSGSAGRSASRTAEGRVHLPAGSEAVRKQQAWQQQVGRSAEDCMPEYVKRIDAAAASQAGARRRRQSPKYSQQAAEKPAGPAAVGYPR